MWNVIGKLRGTGIRERLGGPAIFIGGLLAGALLLPRNLNSEVIAAFMHDVRHSAIGPTVGAALSILTVVWIEDRKRQRKFRHDRDLVLSLLAEIKEEFGEVYRLNFAPGETSKLILLGQLRHTAEHYHAALTDVLKFSQLNRVGDLIAMHRLTSILDYYVPKFIKHYDEMDHDDDNARKQLDYLGERVTDSGSFFAEKAIKSLSAR